MIYRGNMLYLEHKIKVPIICFLVLIICATGVLARTQIDSCLNISTPGSYVLAVNLVDRNSICILINSNDVIFDGAGYMISGTGNIGSIGVEVYNPNSTLTGVEVKNLKIEKWDTGISYRNTSNGTITDNKAVSNTVGITLENSNNNILKNNIVKSNNIGMQLISSAENTVYNNLFNNTNNFNFVYTIHSNKWNISNASELNILNGTFLGGNFWATPSSTGFSQICKDSNIDSLCDSNFQLNPENFDYLPLTTVKSNLITPAPAPTSTHTSTSTPPSTPTSTPTSPQVTPAVQLKIMIISEPGSIMSGQTSVITVSVTGSNDEYISNASVTLTQAKGGELNPSSGQTNLFGEFTSTFKAYSEGNISVKALVKKEGFKESSGEVGISISARTPAQTSEAAQYDGTISWLWAALILLIIAISSGTILYMRKNKAKKKIEETYLCIYCKAPISLGTEFCPHCGRRQEEKKRYCTNCGAPMTLAPERCHKCGRTPSSGTDVKTCKNCGEVIPIVANFCSECRAGQPE